MPGRTHKVSSQSGEWRRKGPNVDFIELYIPSILSKNCLFSKNISINIYIVVNRRRTLQKAAFNDVILFLLTRILFLNVVLVNYSPFKQFCSDRDATRASFNYIVMQPGQLSWTLIVASLCIYRFFLD